MREGLKGAGWVGERGVGRSRNLSQLQTYPFSPVPFPLQIRGVVVGLTVKMYRVAPLCWVAFLDMTSPWRYEASDRESCKAIS